MRNVSVLVVLLFAACNFKSSTTSGSSGTMPSSSSGASSGKAPFPDLNGKTPEEAEASLRAAGFTGRVVVDRTSLACSEDEDATPPEGKIDCQSPEPGEVAYTDKEVRVHVFERTQGIPGMLVRAQLAPLKGMKIEEAKSYLKKLGHSGKVEVSTAMLMSDKCMPDTVCSFEGESGISIDGDMVLYTKK